ncbi:MAG TPA: hypothetical protein DIV86_05220 [Alphaproteobacteria bacterium]|nr:hypothetical protein [Alphaproteobacteria bacterium]
MKNFKIISLLLILLLAGIIFFWQSLQYLEVAGGQLITLLGAKNIKVSSLKVNTLTNSQVEFSDIIIGEDSNLKVHNLKTSYDLSKLISGKLNNLEADDIEVNIYEKDGKFLIAGLEKFLENNPQKDNAAKSINFTDIDSLRKILPERLVIKNMEISLKSRKIEAVLPLDVNFGFDNTETILKIASKNFDLTAAHYELTTGNIQLDAILNENQKWQGNVFIPSIKITKTGDDTADISVKLGFLLSQDNLEADILINDQKNSIKADMKLFMPVAAPSSGNLNIQHIQFPWGVGFISSKLVNVPLNMKEEISAVIKLNNVDLSSTLGNLSEGKIKGTGKISGSFPVVYDPASGKILLKNGEANEVDEGVISVSPELLPGDNTNLELARSTLENFHYTKLQILVSSDAIKSSIALAIEGKNPNSQEKRPVKFNINLTGDMLQLIQQSILPLNDIKQLLKQEK